MLPVKKHIAHSIACIDLFHASSVCYPFRSITLLSTKICVQQKWMKFQKNYSVYEMALSCFKSLCKGVLLVFCRSQCDFE